jgi:hypothetical protein
MWQKHEIGSKGTENTVFSDTLSQDGTMARISFKYFLLSTLLLASPLFALEIRNSVSIGTLNFYTGVDSSPLSAVPEAFTSNLNFKESLSISEKIMERLSFDVCIDVDPILRNRVISKLAYHADFATLSFGPMFGAFNSPQTYIKPGLATSLKLEIPGLIYGILTSESTMGGIQASAHDYHQDQVLIEAGIWLPHVLLSGKMTAKTYKYYHTADTLTIDENVRWDILFDVYKKGIPFRVCLITSMQELRRKYIDSSSSPATEEIDALSSLIAGLRVTVEASSMVEFFVEGEGAVYSWAVGDMLSPAADTALFTVSAGVTLKFDRPKPIE